MSLKIALTPSKLLRSGVLALSLSMALASGSVSLAGTLSPPQELVLKVEGMTCGGCEKAISKSLKRLDFTESVVSTFADGSVCVGFSSEGDTDAIKSAIEKMGYVVKSMEAADVCPSTEPEGTLKDPWEGAKALDVAYISKGETVTLSENLVPGKFTIVDFGAPWCGPCFTAADEIMLYLNAHPDVAVRVVSLHAATAPESYGLPVFDQHLSSVPGIPYFVVFDQTGRQIYKGQRVDAVTKVIDKVRGS